MSGRRQQALWLLIFAGIGVAAYLVYVALDASAEPYCSGVGDCHKVQSSEYAEVAGIPLAVFGLLMYGGLLALRIATTWGPLRSLPILRAWITVLAGSGVLYSVYLTYLELEVIHAICIYCVTSAGIVTLIAIVSWPDFTAARRALAAARSA
ncbi:MAG: vitamin K epoxide reductase family protein [Dehalococcoidia bacterium]|nr:MAG: vitamin K epoxide reductase family protein [Dehalococcoidia bacterium]